VAIRAVLFDVGGPLDLEVTHERLMDAAIQAALGVDEATYAEANAWAVESFASNAYQAIIWRLLGGHDAERGARIYASLSGNEPPDLFELRPGIPDLLADLRGRGVKLGIVANQPARAVGKLKAAGIADLFDCLGLSALVRLQKPDLRLFLAVCDSLQTLPNECIMVGDRIDNDIAPARQLGMHTVLLRYGRHIRQQPRTWLERPDLEAHDTDSMRSAILALLDASGS
jgi:HAD superfamily hydrolase (TIGR01549 family)